MDSKALSHHQAFNLTYTHTLCYVCVSSTLSPRDLHLIFTPSSSTLSRFLCSPCEVQHNHFSAHACFLYINAVIYYIMNNLHKVLIQSALDENKTEIATCCKLHHTNVFKVKPARNICLHKAYLMKQLELNKNMSRLIRLLIVSSFSTSHPP